MSDDASVLIFVAVAAVVVAVASVTVHTAIITSDCEKLGAVIMDGSVYECRLKSK